MLLRHASLPLDYVGLNITGFLAEGGGIEPLALAAHPWFSRPVTVHYSGTFRGKNNLAEGEGFEPSLRQSS